MSIFKKYFEPLSESEMKKATEILKNRYPPMARFNIKGKREVGYVVGKTPSGKKLRIKLRCGKVIMRRFDRDKIQIFSHGVELIN